MGRKSSNNYPKGMTFNKKSKSYFLITRKTIRENGADKTIRKDILLGRTYAAAIKAYYQHVDYVIERKHPPKLFEELGHTVLHRKLKVGEIKDSTYKHYQRCFDKLLLVFTGREISEMYREEIQNYVDCQLHRATRGNHELTFLNVLFNYAEDKLLIDSNPARKVEKLPVLKKGFIPSDYEIEQFKRACPKWLKLYIDLKLKVGFRQSDMLSLNSLCLDRKGIVMIHNKNGFGMRVLYDDELVTLIEQIKTLNFGKATPFKKNWPFFVTQENKAHSTGSFQSAWTTARKNAVAKGYLNQVNFTEHDLRAVAAVRTGSLEKAYQLMGHSSMAVTKEFYYREVLDVQAAPTPKAEDFNLDYINRLGLA